MIQRWTDEVYPLDDTVADRHSGEAYEVAMSMKSMLDAA